jgi:hypothetical protein
MEGILRRLTLTQKFVNTCILLSQGIRRGASPEGGLLEKLGVSLMEVGVSRAQVGVSRVQVGVSKLQVGMSMLQVGVSRVQVGVSRAQVGVSTVHPLLKLVLFQLVPIS